MHFESCSKTYEDVAVDHNSINSDNEPIKKSERPVQYSSFPERYTPHSPVLTTPIDYSDWSTPSGQRPNEITPNGIAIFDVPHAKLALVPKRDDSAKVDTSAQVNVTWSPWEPVSPCRSGCLQSAQGLQLAQRTCRTGNCSGPATSVRLCTPTLQVLN